ncbi:MAG: DUF892 family protein [Verrucomicrobiota bacterium]
MKESIEEITDWLRDAHAMESNLVTMLEKQVSRLTDYPELQQSVAAHAEESKTHALLVEDALKSIGQSTSALKDGFAKFTGMVGQAGVGMASDAPVKIVLANYGAEHFEIACYLSLKTACESVGLDEIAEMCDRILEDERKMVEMLEAYIPEVTTTHLNMNELEESSV